jgi:hypothetical protein
MFGVSVVDTTIVGLCVSLCWLYYNGVTAGSLWFLCEFVVWCLCFVVIYWLWLCDVLQVVCLFPIFFVFVLISEDCFARILFG